MYHKHCTVFGHPLSLNLYGNEFVFFILNAPVVHEVIFGGAGYLAMWVIQCLIFQNCQFCVGAGNTPCG